MSVVYGALVGAGVVGVLRHVVSGHPFYSKLYENGVMEVWGSGYHT